MTSSLIPHLNKTQGREFEDDTATLAGVRAGQQLIIATLSQKPNDMSGQNTALSEAAAAATDALVRQASLSGLGGCCVWVLLCSACRKGA